MKSTNLFLATDIDDKILSGVKGDVLKTSGIMPCSIISGLVKLYGYLIVVLVTVNILKFTNLSYFLMNAINYMPDLFAGVLIFIIGLLVIDFFANQIHGIIKEMDVEGMDVLVPTLKGFLFFVVTLMALDTMLIDTTIFYILFGPLAWGIAILVAFRWGLKEALVAYAKAK